MENPKCFSCGKEIYVGDNKGIYCSSACNERLMEEVRVRNNYTGLKVFAVGLFVIQQYNKDRKGIFVLRLFIGDYLTERAYLSANYDAIWKIETENIEQAMIVLKQQIAEMEFEIVESLNDGYLIKKR